MRTDIARKENGNDPFLGKLRRQKLPSFYHALFLQGANSYGQLGVGHGEDMPFPTKVNLESSQAEILKQIAGGGGHTVLLTCK